MGLMKRNDCDSRTEGMQTEMEMNWETHEEKGVTILKGFGGVYHPNDELGLRAYTVMYRGRPSGEYLTLIQAQAALEVLALQEEGQ